MKLDQKEFTYKNQEFLITLKGEEKHDEEIKQTWEEQGEPERFYLNVDYEDSDVDIDNGISYHTTSITGEQLKQEVLNKFISDEEEFISDQIELYLEE